MRSPLCASSLTINPRDPACTDFRWAIAIILILLEVLMWVLLIGLPWVRAFRSPSIA